MTTLPSAAATRTHDPERLLRAVLTVNAEASLIWGVSATLGATALAEPLGVPAPASVAVGMVAAVASVLFWRFRSRDELRVSEAWVAVLGDAVFGGGLVLAAFLAPEMTMLGRWVVAVSGLFVVDMAVLELFGVRRLGSDAASGVRRSPPL